MKILTGVTIFLLAFSPCLPRARAAEGVESLSRGPLTVMYAPSDHALALQTALRGERLHLAIREEMGLGHSVKVHVLLLTDSLSKRGLKAEQFIEPWQAGAAWSARRTIVLRVRPGETSVDLEPVLAHELTHVILAEDFPSHEEWPLWFIEGIAMRQSRSEGLRRWAALSLASLRRRIIPLGELGSSFPADESGARLAYAESFSVISYLVSEHGEGKFRDLLKALRNQDFEDAFRGVYGFGTGAMEGSWRKWAGRRYSWIPLATGGTAFWALTMAVFFLALAARRRRNRLIEENWEREDGWPPRFPWQKDPR